MSAPDDRRPAPDGAATPRPRRATEAAALALSILLHLGVAAAAVHVAERRAQPVGLEVGAGDAISVAIVDGAVLGGAEGESDAEMEADGVSDVEADVGAETVSERVDTPAPSRIAGTAPTPARPAVVEAAEKEDAVGEDPQSELPPPEQTAPPPDALPPPPAPRPEDIRLAAAPIARDARNRPTPSHEETPAVEPLEAHVAPAPSGAMHAALDALSDAGSGGDGEVAGEREEPGKRDGAEEGEAGADLGGEGVRVAAAPRTGNPPPAYPAHARRRGWEGRVVLEVTISEDGRPTAVALAESSGHDVLDSAALDAVRSWRFTPAERNGNPIVSTLRVPVRFSLQDR